MDFVNWPKDKLIQLVQQRVETIQQKQQTIQDLENTNAQQNPIVPVIPERRQAKSFWK